MQNHCVSTSMQFFDNNCLSHPKLCFAYASASQKENNCASHDCCVPHHCHLISNLFVIRHAKHLWFSHAIKNFPSHITRPPFKLATSGDVQNKTKQNSSTCHAHFFKKIMHHAGQNTKKMFVWFWLFHATCKKKRTCSGVLSSSTNCGQNGLCQFFVIHTGCCPVDIVHPCMFLALAPTKTPCEQIAKTS